MPEIRFNYYNAFGVRKTMIADAATPDKFTVMTSQELDGILRSVEQNRENIRPGSDNKLVAQIPRVIYEQMMLEGWDEDQFRQWLNDPQNDCFRVWRGWV